MTDLITAISVFLGVSVAVPVALIVAMAMRKPHDTVDYSGWQPPDEITEEAALTLYFEAPGRELAPWHNGTD